MSQNARVNIRTTVNKAAIRKEKRNGRDVIIVPSATLPDDVIMNGIKYPAAEIEKSFLTLNRTPAPLGHPMINGQFVSASDPEGINIGYIGAWNENVRRESGRVFMDKVIDVTMASQLEGGRRVIEAINKGLPIHTSTGVFLELKDVSGDVTHSRVATNMMFDHDAILLDEEGAATPLQGVGMMVNKDGESVEVINSALEDADREIDWAGMNLLRSLEAKERASLWDRLKTTIMENLNPERMSHNEERTKPMSAELQKQINDLSATVNALGDSIKGLDITKAVSDAVTNAVKPMAEAFTALQANAKSVEDAKKTNLVAKVVAANLLSEGVAKTLEVNALEELASKIKQGTAPGLVGGLMSNGAEDEFAGVDLNAALKETK